MLPLRQTVADSTETVVRNANSLLDKLETNFSKIRNAATATNFVHLCSTPVYQASMDYRHGYRTGKN
jgi:hypothetical protein